MSLAEQSLPLVRAAVTRPRTARRAGGVLLVAYVGVFGILGLLALIPVAALLLGSFRDAAPGSPGGHWTLANWQGLTSPGVVDTLVNTLVVAGSVAAMAMLFGTAIALIIHRTDFRWAGTMTALMALSFYFPSFILAMAWIVIGSPGGLINDILQDVLGIDWISVDIYTISGIVFVTTLHQIPFVYLTMRGPIMGMDPSYEEAALPSRRLPRDRRGRAFQLRRGTKPGGGPEVFRVSHHA